MCQREEPPRGFGLSTGNHDRAVPSRVSVHIFPGEMMALLRTHSGIEEDSRHVMQQRSGLLKILLFCLRGNDSLTMVFAQGT